MNQLDQQAFTPPTSSFLTPSQPLSADDLAPTCSLATPPGPLQSLGGLPQPTHGLPSSTGLAAQYSQLFSGLCDEPAAWAEPSSGALCEAGAQEPGASAATPADLDADAAVHNAGHDETEEQTPAGKTALRVSKFTHNLMRLPGALKTAGQHGVEKKLPLAAAWPKVERAGAAGESFLSRHLPKNAGRWVENAKNVLGYGTGDAKTILKHLGGKAKQLVATKAAVSGGKLAEKGIGKLVPGLNVAVSLGAAGLDLKELTGNVKKKNYVGAAIDGLHAATDAAGIMPGVGTAISLAGDALSIGAHWLTGR